MRQFEKQNRHINRFQSTCLGNEAFTGYLSENYDKKICAGKEIIFIVKFNLNSTGRPGNIRIQENSGPAMETEIKRLLPLWSEGNREVTLKIKL